MWQKCNQYDLWNKNMKFCISSDTTLGLRLLLQNKTCNSTAVLLLPAFCPPLCPASDDRSCRAPRKALGEECILWRLVSQVHQGTIFTHLLKDSINCSSGSLAVPFPSIEGPEPSWAGPLLPDTTSAASLGWAANVLFLHL